MLQVSTERKKTAVRMKTVTLGLGGSSGRKEREERTHLEVSIKTKVPG